MRIETKLLKLVLESLYTDSFPSSCTFAALGERIGKKVELKDFSPIEAALRYLADKDLVKVTRSGGGTLHCRITALGVDKLHRKSLI